MNIGAVATFDHYNEFEHWANVAYKRFMQREDLGGNGLIPQEVQVSKTEIEGVPETVTLELVGLPPLILPVTGHETLGAKHVRVCVPVPALDEGEAVW
jgi:hypothetical protein